jgi:Ca-activated chloride channel family protein
MQPLLATAALATWAIALAQPVVWQARQTLAAGGVKVMLMVDVSESMRAEDMRPNRLEVAKEQLMQLMALRPQDQVALGIFGAGALSYVPFTKDHAYVKDRLVNLQIGILPSDATAMGDGMGWGINRLSEASGQSDKVLLLATDGANNAGGLDPLSAARYAQTMGLRVCVLSCSNPELGAAWVQAAKAKSDHTYLTQIAEAGKGLCVRADDPMAANRLAEFLEQLQGEAGTTQYLQEAIPKQTLWIALGVGLLLLAAVLQALWLHNPIED